MFIVCSNCDFKYLVNSADLKPNGRMVECANCGHQWFQKTEKQDNSFSVPSTKKLNKESDGVDSQKTEDKNSNILGRINKYMVCNGQAVAYTRYSYEYFECENTAKKNKIGIWAGEFDRPEDWRRKYN